VVVSWRIGYTKSLRRGRGTGGAHFCRELASRTWATRAPNEVTLSCAVSGQYDCIIAEQGAVEMADLDLTQEEADKLMAMEKRAVNQSEWTFPGPAERIVVPLISADKRESFLLDVTRYQIKLTKATFQSRARVAIILYRLDVDGAPHRNPDGQDVPCPHLHVYREGYGDKWAEPAPSGKFPDTTDLFSTLYAFMRHCNITEPPRIEKGLFS